MPQQISNKENIEEKIIKLGKLAEEFKQQAPKKLLVKNFAELNKNLESLFDQSCELVTALIKLHSETNNRQIKKSYQTQLQRISLVAKKIAFAMRPLEIAISPHTSNKETLEQLYKNNDGLKVYRYFGSKFNKMMANNKVSDWQSFIRKQEDNKQKPALKRERQKQQEVGNAALAGIELRSNAIGNILAQPLNRNDAELDKEVQNEVEELSRTVTPDEQADNDNALQQLEAQLEITENEALHFPENLSNYQIPDENKELGAEDINFLLQPTLVKDINGADTHILQVQQFPFDSATIESESNKINNETPFYNLISAAYQKAQEHDGNSLLLIPILTVNTNQTATGSHFVYAAIEITQLNDDKQASITLWDPRPEQTETAKAIITNLKITLEDITGNSVEVKALGEQINDSWSCGDRIVRAILQAAGKNTPYTTTNDPAELRTQTKQFAEVISKGNIQIPPLQSSSNPSQSTTADENEITRIDTYDEREATSLLQPEDQLQTTAVEPVAPTTVQPSQKQPTRWPSFITRFINFFTGSHGATTPPVPQQALGQTAPASTQPEVKREQQPSKALGKPVDKKSNHKKMQSTRRDLEPKEQELDEDLELQDVVSTPEASTPQPRVEQPITSSQPDSKDTNTRLSDTAYTVPKDNVISINTTTAPLFNDEGIIHPFHPDWTEQETLPQDQEPAAQVLIEFNAQLDKLKQQFTALYESVQQFNNLTINVNNTVEEIAQKADTLNKQVRDFQFTTLTGVKGNIDSILNSSPSSQEAFENLNKELQTLYTQAEDLQEQISLYKKSNRIKLAEHILQRHSQLKRAIDDFGNLVITRDNTVNQINEKARELNNEISELEQAIANNGDITSSPSVPHNLTRDFRALNSDIIQSRIKLNTKRLTNLDKLDKLLKPVAERNLKHAEQNEEIGQKITQLQANLQSLLSEITRFDDYEVERNTDEQTIEEKYISLTWQAQNLLNDIPTPKQQLQATVAQRKNFEDLLTKLKECKQQIDEIKNEKLNELASLQQEAELNAIYDTFANEYNRRLIDIMQFGAKPVSLAISRQELDREIETEGNHTIKVTQENLEKGLNDKIQELSERLPQSATITNTIEKLEQLKKDISEFVPTIIRLGNQRVEKYQQLAANLDNSIQEIATKQRKLYIAIQTFQKKTVAGDLEALRALKTQGEELKQQLSIQSSAITDKLAEIQNFHANYKDKYQDTLTRYHNRATVLFPQWVNDKLADIESAIKAAETEAQILTLERDIDALPTKIQPLTTLEIKPETTKAQLQTLYDNFGNEAARLQTIITTLLSQDLTQIQRNKITNELTNKLNTPQPLARQIFAHKVSELENKFIERKTAYQELANKCQAIRVSVTSPDFFKKTGNRAELNKLVEEREKLKRDTENSRTAIQQEKIKIQAFAEPSFTVDKQNAIAGYDKLLGDLQALESTLGLIQKKNEIDSFVYQLPLNFLRANAEGSNNYMVWFNAFRQKNKIAAKALNDTITKINKAVPDNKRAALKQAIIKAQEGNINDLAGMLYGNKELLQALNNGFKVINEASIEYRSNTTNDFDSYKDIPLVKAASDRKTKSYFEINAAANDLLDKAEEKLRKTREQLAANPLDAAAKQEIEDYEALIDGTLTGVTKAYEQGGVEKAKEVFEKQEFDNFIDNEEKKEKFTQAKTRGRNSIFNEIRKFEDIAKEVFDKEKKSTQGQENTDGDDTTLGIGGP